MVNQALLQPQEIEVFYILPAIRTCMARSLKAQGLSQKAIAKLLSVRESTVSQYINGKRGAEVVLTPEIEEAVRQACSRMSNPMSFVAETQLILKQTRVEGLLCQVHRKVSGLPESCNIAKVGCA